MSIRARSKHPNTVDLNDARTIQFPKLGAIYSESIDFSIHFDKKYLESDFWKH